MPELREKIQSHLSGSFKLGRELGGGGMSRVFLAEDSSLGRTVVVKVLAPELAAGLNAERFKREIMLAAQLQHPHIVPVLSTGVADDLPFFVMPFVAGESLRHRLAGAQSIPTAEAVSILRDVAKALGFAHANGVVHRDIKPDNVLLAGESAVVTDFGIAKAISSAVVEERGGTLTQAGTSLGTPVYMSPEQASGDPNADARSDFYSFGVMAYEMVSGKPPFEGPSHSLIMSHIAELPEPVAQVSPAVPAALAAVIMRCLAKEPSLRPQNAKEILDALDDVDIAGLRTRSGPQAAPATGNGLWKGRRPWILAGALGVLAIAVLAGLKLSSKPASAAVNDQRMVVLPFRIASADAGHRYLREGMVDLVAAKLSGDELRAIEPRIVLEEWRKVGGTEATDISRESTLLLAQKLGAGKALLGDVVGTSKQIVLSVSLLAVPDGKQITRISVEGSPDSLGSLVDQIATKLLTETSGEAPTRIATLSSVSLPALRAYLDGKSRVRRGDAAGAAKDFERALKEDSTFALAGLGLRFATSWYGDAQLGGRGIAVAFRERARLSFRDSLLLVALAGPKYPAAPKPAELYAAREQYLGADPTSAEANYLFADHIFHYGATLGIPDWEQRALDGFKKAMELDSLYLPGYTHALPLAPSLGDVAFTTRVYNVRSKADTGSLWKLLHQWEMAVRTGNSREADKIFSAKGPLQQPFQQSIIQHALFDGTGGGFLRRAVETIIASTATPAARRMGARAGHDLLLNAGRPADAMRYLEQAFEEKTSVDRNIILVRSASVGEIPREAARSAAADLARRQLEPMPGDSAGKMQRRAIIRVIELWRLVNGDTTMTRRSLRQLRELAAAVPGPDRTEAPMEIQVIEMLFAQHADAPNVRQLTQTADSLLANMDYAAFHAGRAAQFAILTAKSWERLREPARALTTVGRTTNWNNVNVPYLGTQLREQGRLAVLAGDRKRAIRAYSHYLQMRTDAEPSVASQVDSVKRELAQISRN